jgi:hypothetical protein
MRWLLVARNVCEYSVVPARSFQFCPSGSLICVRVASWWRRSLRRNCGAGSGARKIRRWSAVARVSLRSWRAGRLFVRRPFACWWLALTQAHLPAIALRRAAPTRMQARVALVRMRFELAPLRYSLERWLMRFGLWGLRLVCTGRCDPRCRLGSLRRSKDPSPAANRSPAGTWLTCRESAQR